VSEPLRSKYGENHLLIADADRNAAVSRLEQAVGRGLLDLDEFISTSSLALVIPPDAGVTSAS
jgi:hypothetical protein